METLTPQRASPRHGPPGPGKPPHSLGLQFCGAGTPRWTELCSLELLL